MKLALFDLDHTLIPFDSGLAWTRFLIRRGVLADGVEETYLGHARQYVAGTLDMHAMHFAAVAPLAAFERPVLDGWAREFEAAMAPRIPADMQALVRAHQDAGDRCAIVTATTRLVAAPFARLFGIRHLMASEAASSNGAADGRLTGGIQGEPCFRQHKVAHVAHWLATAFEPALRLHEFDQSWFYSDSVSDLPLLEAVSHPVAVRPDERLRAHALAHGWRLIE